MNFIRIKEVVRKVGLSKASIYRLEAAGIFPKRKKTGFKAVAFIESEINDWITSRSEVNPSKKIKLEQK